MEMRACDVRAHGRTVIPGGNGDIGWCKVEPACILDTVDAYVIYVRAHWPRSRAEPTDLLAAARR